MQVNPSETWLRDDCDGTAFFPLDDGNFNLSSLGVSSYATLVVEGPALSASVLPRSSILPRQPPSVTVSSTPTSSPLPPPAFRSVTAPKRMASFSLKVVKATMCRQGKRKPEFQPISQTYLDLIDSTANLEHIHSIVQRRWGTEYTIVTNDGLPLEDSPATQGWFCYRSKSTYVRRFRFLYAPVHSTDSNMLIIFPIQDYPSGNALAERSTLSARRTSGTALPFLAGSVLSG